MTSYQKILYSAEDGVARITLNRPEKRNALDSELIAEAKDALASCYEGDSFSFWPKKEYYPNTPEEVRVVGSDGDIVVQYDLVALLRDTNRSLIGDRIC